MKTTEALDYLAQFLQGETQDGFFSEAVRLRALNEANRRVCLDLQIPKARLELNGITGSYAVPADCSDESPVQILLGGYQLPVLTWGEADNQYPAWQERTDMLENFAIYDPIYEPRLIRFYPEGRQYDYILYYVKSPRSLSLEADTVPVMEGLLPSFHTLVPIWAAYRLYEMDGKIDKAGYFYQQYQIELNRADGFVGRGGTVPPLLLK